MKCKDFQNNILFFIDGDLDKMDAARFEKHLEVCSQCKQLFEKISGTYSLIEASKITESNPFFYTRVKAAIENTDKKPVWSAKKVVLQWATYSIIGLFAILAGYFIAHDKNYIEQASLQEQNKKMDEELFADSHYLTLSSEEIYIVSVDEIEEE